MQTNVTWNSNNVLYVPNRFQTNYDYECSQSTRSPPPSLVRNFTVISYSFKFSEITLNLSWSPPLVPNGELAPYNICIGIQPLRPDEEVQPNTGHFCNTTVDDSMHMSVILLFIKPIDHECLYVQVSYLILSYRGPFKLVLVQM